MPAFRSAFSACPHLVFILGSLSQVPVCLLPGVRGHFGLSEADWHLLNRCFGGNLWASSGGWDLRHMFFLLAALMCLLRLAQPLPGSPNCWDKASLSLGCLSRQDQMFSSWKQSWEAISSSLLQQDRILHPSLPGWGGEDL